MTRTEKSWILYDVANSAFVLIMITAIMPLFFKNVAAAGMENSDSTAIWCYAVSTAALITAVLSPFIGSYGDFRDRKKKMFIFFLFIGVGANLLLALTGQGQWIYCIVLFIIAKISWASSNVFYDSFLTDVTTPERMDMISSKGYAWGYIGSVIPLIAAIVILLLSGKPPSVSSYHIAFVISALWWLVFSIPMLKNVKQQYYIEPGAAPLRDSIARLVSTLRNVKENRNVFIFLAAYFFYIDGVDTIISMAMSYGRDSGLGITSLILAILMTQVLAFPFALLYGRLAEKFSAKNMITAGIIIYIMITTLAFFLPDFTSLYSKNIVFWILSFMVATSMGGIQALSRSYYGKIIPSEKSAEFFGLYNIFGKFSAITGPLLIGLTSSFSRKSRYGVLFIVFLFIAALFILQRTEKDNV